MLSESVGYSSWRVDRDDEYWVAYWPMMAYRVEFEDGQMKTAFEFK